MTLKPYTNCLKNKEWVTTTFRQVPLLQGPSSSGTQCWTQATRHVADTLASLHGLSAPVGGQAVSEATHGEMYTSRFGHTGWPRCCNEASSTLPGTGFPWEGKASRAELTNVRFFSLNSWVKTVSSGHFP